MCISAFSSCNMVLDQAYHIRLKAPGGLGFYALRLFHNNDFSIFVSYGEHLHYILSSFPLILLGFREPAMGDKSLL